MNFLAEREGFLPLRKAMSEPARSRSLLLSRVELKERAWVPVKKMASFTKEPIVELGAVVIVDPYSTGAALATKAVDRGFEVVRVLSEGSDSIASLVADGQCADFVATVSVDGDNYDKAAEELRKLPYHIVALVAGAETGVRAADELAVRLGLRGNDIAFSEARRNKFLQGEAVRRAGARAVSQKVVTTWAEASAFLVEEKKTSSLGGGGAKKNFASPFGATVVVKPLDSAGSDDVFKCESAAEVKEAVEAIVGKRNGLGGLNAGALVQEFLRGDEYVVDSVSRDGEHKVVAIWVYDKRHANGADFVYHGMSLVSAAAAEDGGLFEALAAYSRIVLDALKVANGPSHMEIKVDPDSLEPCLVEVGARCHGGEGTWLPIADACVGYDQVDVTLDAYLDKEAFDKVPSTPPPLRKFGAELFFVTKTSGMVRSTERSTAYLRNLPSLRELEWQVKPGDFAALTVDCFTRPGSAQLIHESRTQLEEDCQKARSLEKPTSGPVPPPLLDLEFVCRKPIDRGTVVVVDPYSSGAILAERVRSRHRKKLVVVHSDPKSPIATLVASGTDVRPHSVLAFEGKVEDLATQVDGRSPIIAVLPGAETGVILADDLAEALGTRANPSRLSAARRNKYLMGDAVRRAGVRAVRQCKATTWDDAKAFLASLEEDIDDDSDIGGPRQCRPQRKKEIYPLVVKPIESAGSDDVFKCASAEEVKEAVRVINGKVNGLGNVNEGALVQEFLRGDEYVVDAVSRDGVHKIVAIWRYDKRSVNGANFVYFGMGLVDESEGGVFKILATYSNLVRDALEIRDGPSHMEIKVDPDSLEPCLVEVGARCHGGEGTWLPVADACVGYNQVDVTLDAYLDPDAFDAYPSVPPPFKNFGREVFLVSYQEGTLEKIHVDKIRSLKSFAKCELAVQPGSILKPTTDCFTRPGSVQLIHPDPNVVRADYDAVRRLEQKSALFKLVPN